MTGRPDGVAPVAEEQHAAVANVLAHAFHLDPLFVQAFPDPAVRARCLPAIFRWHVRYGVLFGEVLGTGDPLDGVAVALRPGEGDFAEERLAKSGIQHMREELGPAAAGQYTAALQRLVFPADGALKRMVPEPHWYLDVIGVEPGRQGRGIGSALLAAVNQLADRDAVSAALLTFQRNNLPLYQRHGYAVVCNGVELTSGLGYWGGRRRPGA
jgi:ribosomal protein S18 acetylase RimI-like enzyme